MQFGDDLLTVLDLIFETLLLLILAAANARDDSGYQPSPVSGHDGLLSRLNRTLLRGSAEARKDWASEPIP